MTLPNFLIIGATKAGTTSLYDYLRQHPDIFMPGHIKEPRFFCYDGRETGFPFPVKSQAEYEALFAPATTETRLGEATPHYLSFPKAAAKIRALIPQAKLIASLRNPVTRSFSLYQMNMREQGVNEGVPYAQALETDRWLRETYAENIARYVELFPRDQFKVLLFEDVTRDTKATLRDVLTFLEVDSEFAPDISKPSNVGGVPRWPALHRALSDRRLRAAGQKLFPEPVKARLRALRSLNLEQQPMTGEERRIARDFFREDILRTQDLIDRDLSGWLAE